MAFITFKTLLTRDERLSEQYHRRNAKTSEIHWEHRQFKIFLEVTQTTNSHCVGRKSKFFSPGTDFVSLIFTGKLFGVDSAGVLRKGVLMNCL